MTLKQNIVDNAPVWLTNGINKILYHPGTPWFFLGMGFEALGLSIQFLFQGSSYPVFDAIIAFILGYTILYYHQRNTVAE
jgi:hypothetical protein